MKKSLSLLLAIVMVFSMFAGVASAADNGKTALEKYQELSEKGIFRGVDESGNPALDQPMTRAMFARVAALILGLEGISPDGDTKIVAEAPFKDVNIGDWFVEEVAAVKEAGIMVGNPDGTFNPNGNITVQELAVVTAQSLGLQPVEGAEVPGADWWAARYIAALQNAGIDFPTNYKDNATREQLVTVSYSVYQVVNAPATLEIAQFAQTGAKKLTVKFNKAVNGNVNFSVKRDGNATVNITDVKWNDAKTEAVLTASFNLQTGKYTVKVTGEGIDLEATADGVAAKISAIEFNSDIGVITDSTGIAGPDKQGLRTSIKILNQYGEDVTASVAQADLDIKATKGELENYDKGLISLRDGSAVDHTKDYVVDQKVVVTVVHGATGTVASKTLTVAQAANVASIEIGDITTDDEDLKKKPINVRNIDTEYDKYYIPITVKDQYGNVLKKADLANLSIISSNTKILKVNSAANLKEIGTEKKTAIAIMDTDTTETNGVVVITVVAPNGTNASKTFEILANPKIDVISFETPAILKKSVKTKLTFAAQDQFGNALVSATELPSNDNTVDSTLEFSDDDTNPTKITVTGGTIEAGIDYANKNARTISITPNANADTVVLTVVTATGKPQTYTWSVQAAPTPVAFKGLNAKVYTALQQGQEQVVNTSDLLLQDQYGDEIKLPSNWKIEVTAQDGTFDTVTASVYSPTTVLVSGTPGAGQANSTTFTAAANLKGTETVEFKLVNNENKEVDLLTVRFESVALQDITQFQIADIKTVYTGGNQGGKITVTDYDRAVTLEGLKGSTKVKVDQNLIKGITSTGGLSIDQTNKKIKAGGVETKGEEKTATLTVIVDAYNGAQTLTKEVKYSDAAPVAKSIRIMKTNGTADTSDDAEITEAAFVTTKALNGQKIGPVGFDGDNVDFYFEVKDQYDVVFDDDLTFAVTGKDFENAAHTIEIDGEGKVTISDNQPAGRSFTVTLLTSNGLTKQLKVIFGVNSN